jgi:hypothetical protein
MISLFSNYLRPFIDEGLLQDLDQSKPSNVYELLRIAYNQGASGVIHTTKFFVPYYDGQDPDDYDYDLLYYIYSNKHLQELINWFNSKIIPEFIGMSYQTISVRMRIFTSKLNTLVEKGDVDKEMAIRMHLNMTETLQNEKFLLINEDLPF